MDLMTKLMPMHAAIAAEAATPEPERPPFYPQTVSALKKRNVEEVLRAVRNERYRQNQLYLEGYFPFECCDPSIDGELKLPVLGEEFGEVCKALYERRLPYSARSTEEFFQMRRERRAHFRAELIQLAAVACAWAESIDTK